LNEVVEKMAIAEKAVLVGREGERRGGEREAEVERGGDSYAGVRDGVAADGVDFEVRSAEGVEGLEGFVAAPGVDQEDVGMDRLES